MVPSTNFIFIENKDQINQIRTPPRGTSEEPTLGYEEEIFFFFFFSCLQQRDVISKVVPFEKEKDKVDGKRRKRKKKKIQYVHSRA